MTLLKLLDFQYWKSIRYKDFISSSTTSSYFTPCLQHHRNDYQPNTNTKREIQLFVLAENEHRKDDAVNGFEVVGQVDGEGGNFLKHNDLQ